MSTAMISVAAQGPRRTAASVPPSKCPLTPAATGKFAICAANTKAAMIPMAGGSRCPPRRASKRAATITVSNTSAASGKLTRRLKSPSGACIASTPFEIQLGMAFILASAKTRRRRAVLRFYHK